MSLLERKWFVRNKRLISSVSPGSYGFCTLLIIVPSEVEGGLVWVFLVWFGVCFLFVCVCIAFGWAFGLVSFFCPLVA